MNSQPGRNIIIFGFSNAGKDTLALLIEKIEPSFELFHPHYYHRDHLEDVYGLNRGTLRTDQGKRMIAPGANSTYGRILEDSYHFWLKHDPEFCTRVMRTSFKPQENHVVIGIRNLAEAAHLRNLVRTGQITIDLCLWVTAKDEIKKDTDRLQIQMYDDLKSYSRKYQVFYNMKEGILPMTEKFNQIWSNVK